MPSLWIVHRDAATRAALVRLAGAASGTVSGPPGHARFDDATTPDAVLLGLDGDLESELEFAHRTLRRARRAIWVVVAPRESIESARQAFDVLPARFLAWPPQARELRRALEAPRIGDAPLPLSQRPGRDALSRRFARSLGELELPGLLRALDPRLGDVPLLVRGEPGTGRETLARYVHHFGATAGGLLVELACGPEQHPEDLLARIAGRRGAGEAACSVILADVHELRPESQRVLAGWIQHGMPRGAAPAALVRWMATASEADLPPELEGALTGIGVTLPPLRERPGGAGPLARETAAAWCEQRGLPPRGLSDEAVALLDAYPWPGNVRELEAVVQQSLAAGSADPLEPGDVIFPGESLVPLDTDAVGELLDEEAAAIDDDEEEPLVRAVPEQPGEALAPPAVPAPAVQAAAEAAASPPPESTAGVKHLSAALGHELRNPLTAVRTFAELLPERHRDPEFRERFSELVATNLRRVDGVLGRLEAVGRFDAPKPTALDLNDLLEELIASRRERMHRRRLVVLTELEPGNAQVRCDPEQLHFAFEAILDRGISLLPERGDVYLASRRHDTGLRGAPCVRVLLRLGRPDGVAGPQHRDVAPAANTLEFALAELVIRAMNGDFTLDASDRSETVLVIDLPA